MSKKQIIQFVDDDKFLYPVPSSEGVDFDNIIATQVGNPTPYTLQVDKAYVIITKTWGSSTFYVNGTSQPFDTYIKIKSGDVISVSFDSEAYWGNHNLTIYGIKYF